jgi:hypothetical protein
MSPYGKTTLQVESLPEYLRIIIQYIHITLFFSFSQRLSVGKIIDGNFVSVESGRGRHKKDVRR